MNSKTTWILLLLAGAMFAFIWFFERHLQAPGDSGSRPALLEDVHWEDVTAVQVRPAGQIEIRAVQTNGTWMLTRPIAYPAEAGAVEALVHALKAMKGDTRQPSRSNSDKEFGFDPPRFTVLVQQGDRIRQVLVGNGTLPKGEQVYIQVVGEEGICVEDASLLRFLPSEADDWRSRSLVDWKGLVYDRISITNGTRICELEKAGVDGPWRMVRPMTARVDNPRLQELLRQTRDLRVVEFATNEARLDLAACGLQPPNLILAFSQGQNPVAMLEFGISPADKPELVYARRVGRSAVMLVPGGPLQGWRSAHEELRERRLVQLPTAEVEEVEVRGVGPFVLRRLSNEVWQVTSPEMIPADPVFVREFLGALNTIEAAQFVKDVVTSLMWRDYGLDPPTREILVRSSATNAVGAARQTLADIQFGSLNDNLLYARRTDEQAVYGVRLRDVQALPVAGWQLRDRRLWNFTENDVSRVNLVLEGQSFDLTRLGANQWTLPSPPPPMVNDLALDEVMHRLGGLETRRWVSRGNELRERCGFSGTPTSVSVELKNGTRLLLEIGGVSPRSGLVYGAVALGGENWIVELPADLFEYLRQQLGIQPGKS
jgi:hypothetical protein